jgi:hypothetical protein
MFAPERSIQLRLMFSSKAGAYLSGAFASAALLTSPAKNLTRPKGPIGDKHCSLFGPFVSYEQKMF